MEKKFVMIRVPRDVRDTLKLLAVKNHQYIHEYITALVVSKIDQGSDVFDSES